MLTNYTPRLFAPSVDSPACERFGAPSTGSARTFAARSRRAGARRSSSQRYEISFGTARQTFSKPGKFQPFGKSRHCCGFTDCTAQSRPSRKTPSPVGRPISSSIPCHAHPRHASARREGAEKTQTPSGNLFAFSVLEFGASPLMFRDETWQRAQIGSFRALTQQPLWP